MNGPFLKKSNCNPERVNEMTVLLPMNRIRDELKKVDQFRKNGSPIVSFIQQASDLLELEEKNLGLALIVGEARKKNIPLLWCNGNLKIIEVDPRGTNGEKLKELGYSMQETSLIDFNKSRLNDRYLLLE